MGIKLNLGCGSDLRPGYLNVDKFGNPDMRIDLECFPWPWDDNSVEEIVLHHVLEHIGHDPAVFLRIIQELYRVSQPDTAILIEVPHPRHETFIGDPTHVRPVTQNTLKLFDQKLNKEWIETDAPNSLLGLHLSVDFEIESVRMILDAHWDARLRNGELKDGELQFAIRSLNNVIKSLAMVWRAKKPGRYPAGPLAAPDASSHE